MNSNNYKNEKTRFKIFNIPKFLNSKMGELKKKYLNFLGGNFSIARKFQKTGHFQIPILNFRTIEPFVSSIFEFIILGLLNFKNVEIHIFELTFG